MICESLGLFEVVKDKHTLCSQANVGESCESDPVNSDAAVGGGGGGMESVPNDGVSILSGLS